MTRVNLDEMRSWVERIRKHALENYNHDGWDFVIETMSEAEMVEQWTDKPLTMFDNGMWNGRICTTYEEAFAEIKYLCQLLDDKRKDIQSTAW